MKKHNLLYPTVAAVVLSGLFLYFNFNKIYGQTAEGGPALVSKTVSSAPVEAKKTFAPAMIRAASENKRLSTSLRWAFGGKTQVGWSLYSHLIAHTIGTEAGPDSPEFAQALSAWQTRSGLRSTGVLDANTLQSFVNFWQSQRLGRSAYPSPDKLLSAPITDFWDSTRDANLLQLEKETYAAYKRMIAEAAKDKSLGLKLTKDGELAPDEKFLRIVSAFRSREYQEQLRRRSPNSGRAGLARHSPHFTGQALDIYVGGEPVTTKDANRAIQVETPAYKWLVKNAHRFGFYPYFYEPWHWEYVPSRVSK